MIENDHGSRTEEEVNFKTQVQNSNTNLGHPETAQSTVRSHFEDPSLKLTPQTMAKWRRLYHESIAAVFARRLYWHEVAFSALNCV
jgi:hypothetical protein